MKRDVLDEAIDATAARMTAVAADDELARRIVTSLPERSGWSRYWLMPRLAITAALAIATTFVVLRMFDDRSTAVLRTEVVSAPAATPSPIVEPPAIVRRTNVEPPAIVRRTIAEPPLNDRRAVDVPDFDRSLPAIAAVAALEFDSLAPVSLPEDAPLTLAPLAIADLPLTAEPISPR
jgi:hypothetical protein